ncbi:MAG TPA: DUF5677 domain-containing protein [Chitinophagaceae bacterium]|nr:DUF5677 domain-containing protein [Chitinophagaceae bacterium]
MDWKIDKPVIVEAYYNCINANNRELFLRLNNNISKAKKIYPFVSFIEERLSAVWLLALNDKLWDAEIIDRSVLEVLMKFMFIVNAPDESEQEVRFREYWDDLFEISCIKHSEQSKKQLQHYTDEVSQLAHSPIVLNEEHENLLKQKWKRKDRKNLEQKWSFSEILFSLAKNYKGQPFEMMIGLAHEYRMCSHIAHGDETGIGIIEERKSRSEKQRKDVHIGHFIKLLSNCLSYATATSYAAMDFLNLDINYFMDNLKKIQNIKDVENKYQLEVFNDPLYEKFINKM